MFIVVEKYTNLEKEETVPALVNVHNISCIHEHGPDTIIYFTGNTHIIVKETMEKIITMLKSKRGVTN